MTPSCLQQASGICGIRPVLENVVYTTGASPAWDTNEVVQRGSGVPSILIIAKFSECPETGRYLAYSRHPQAQMTVFSGGDSA